jgi:hypothetical protein
MSSELIRKAKVSSVAGADATFSAPSTEGACDHCGDSLAGLKVVQRQLGASLRLYCCNGCAFIAEQLFLAQAGARDREALTSGLGGSESATVASTATRQVRVDVRGMVCAACGAGACRLHDPADVRQLRREARIARRTAARDPARGL